MSSQTTSTNLSFWTLSAATRTVAPLGTMCATSRPSSLKRAIVGLFMRNFSIGIGVSFLEGDHHATMPGLGDVPNCTTAWFNLDVPPHSVEVGRCLRAANQSPDSQLF